MKLWERLSNLLLKEEAYEVTVKRNESPRIAPVLTRLPNITVTKSFDLRDLERHRFMVQSKMDAHVIEDLLKDALKKNRVSVNTSAITIAPATQKSLEEGILTEENEE